MYLSVSIEQQQLPLVAIHHVSESTFRKYTTYSHLISTEYINRCQFALLQCTEVKACFVAQVYVGHHHHHYLRFDDRFPG